MARSRPAAGHCAVASTWTCAATRRCARDAAATPSAPRSACCAASASPKAPLTGRYDARTAAAVSKAQRRLDLPETGRLTRSTWTALLARGGRPLLKVGDTGAAVLRLQRALTAALGRPVRIDGVVDKGTARAVAAYQRKQGLPATGVVTTRGVGQPHLTCRAYGPGSRRQAQQRAADDELRGAGRLSRVAPIRRVPVWSTR